MFSQFAAAWNNSNSSNNQQLPPGVSALGSTSSPTILREDLYKAIQAADKWLKSSTPGDSFSYRPVLALIQPHYSHVNIQFGTGQEEVPILVGAITNMALDLGKLDGMMGAMAIGSWVDTLEGVIRSWQAKEETKLKERGQSICEGIVRGVNNYTDSGLVSGIDSFAPKVQIVGSLKRVAQKVYGTGSDTTRQSDALWGSRLML